MDGKTRKRRVNMQDVARRAGVSQSTVSLVVNKVPTVAAETRERVSRAIEELGFRANRSARNLRGSPSKTIGFVTNQMATSPFAGRTILGAQEVAWKHGHVLLVVDVGDSAELTDTAVNVLLDQDVSGIIYAAMTPKSLYIPAPLRDVPFIVVNADPRGIEEFPLVDAGNYDGGALAARTLLAAGHTRILYLAGEPENPVTNDRERGFRDVMASLPASLVEFRIDYGTYEISSGYRRMRTAIEQDAWWPSAIFAANDRVALGVVQALSEAGRRVPDDMSLLGYDDQPALADQVHPALTTITLPHLEMGQLAVKALLEQIDSGLKPGPVMAHPQLIVRESIRVVGPSIEAPQPPGQLSRPPAVAVFPIKAKGKSPHPNHRRAPH
jgi:LacI family transcriptional regulator